MRRAIRQPIRCRRRARLGTRDTWWHAFYATVLVGVAMLTLVQGETAVLMRA